MSADRDYWTELKQLLRWFMNPGLPPPPVGDRPGSSRLIWLIQAHISSAGFFRACPGSFGLVQLVLACSGSSGLVRLIQLVLTRSGSSGSFGLVLAHPGSSGLIELV